MARGPGSERGAGWRRVVPAPGVMDPRHLYELRREAAQKAAREHVTRERGEPVMEEERARVDEEVARLVEEWTEGWDVSFPRARSALWRPWRRRV